MILRCAFLVFILLLSATAAAQTATSFTYQGRLYNNGTLVNGQGYVLRITAYGQASGGAAIAGPVTTAPLDVVDGVFSTTLDFGTALATTTPSWLEIEVQAPASSFVLLQPRQPVTAAPYAINADKVDGLDAAQIRSIVSVATFSGFIPLVGVTPGFQFVGSPTNVTITPTQRLIGAASASFGSSAGATANFSLCWQQGAGPINPFPGLDYTVIQVSAQRIAQSASNSTVPGVSGVVAVGACVQVLSGTLNTSDQVNGWVIVSN